MSDGTDGGRSDVASVLEHLEPYGERTSDWWQVLDEARARCPVTHSDGGGGFWLVTRYEDVAKILQSPRIFSSTDGITLVRQPDNPQKPPIELDPPLQRDFRRLLNPHLTPAVVREQHGTAIRDMAQELIGRFVGKGHCEFIEAFAGPLPAMVLGRLVLRIEDMDALFDIQERMKVLGTAQDTPEATAAYAFLRNYINGLLNELRERPNDGGLLGGLVHGTVDGRPITEDEQLGTLIVLILGGLETTKDALSWMILRLIETADGSLEQRLCDRASLVRDIDEFLRIDAPVQWVGRTVREPVDVGGVHLEPGDRVMAHLASANRDKSLCEDGDQLQFDRGAGGGRHLSFGLGAHRCVGSNLARYVIELGISELLAQVSDIALDGEAELHARQGQTRHIDKLPIRFRRRS